MAPKKFLTIGNLLINPDLLAYAALEGEAGDPRLRLGFATSSDASSRAEVRLDGEDVGVAIRWLRLHSTPLTTEGAFGSIGGPLVTAAPGQAADGGPRGRAVPQDAETASNFAN